MQSRTVLFKQLKILHLKSNPIRVFSFVIIVVFLLGSSQSVISQSLIKSPVDTSKTTISDSLLTDIVLKVASYSATIDHTDFLIKRKFDLTSISLDLPEIERRVKGFKS